MSSVNIGEENERVDDEVHASAVIDPVERSDPDSIDIGTDAPHIVCIDQLCEAIDICHREPFQKTCEEDGGIGEDVDLSKQICSCVIDPLIDYATQENLRNKLKNEMIQAMVQAEFIDEFMGFFMEDLLEAIFSTFPKVSFLNPVVDKSFGEPFDKSVDDSADKTVDDRVDHPVDDLTAEQEQTEKVPEITNDNIYLWMSYFYMQYCGYQLFLSTLASHAGASITVKTEMAAIITDIVDEVAQSSEYLEHISDVTEKICKNIIWGMLNTRRFYRRSVNMSEAQIVAGDIIDNIVQKIVKIKEQESFVEFGGPRRWTIVRETMLYENFLEPETCKDFMGIDKVANRFISDLITKSKERAYEIFKRADRRMQNISIEAVLKVFPDFRGSRVFEFPSIEEFSVDGGIEAIEDYMLTWNFSEDWIYDIRFLIAQSDACSDYYFFEAIWSIPTVLYPVPQTTASIIFRIEVSRVKPPECQVTYKLEGRGLVHTPCTYDFKEEWLFDIMYSKLKLYETLRF